MNGICIKCKENKYIYCKKRQLCTRCYQRWYKEENPKKAKKAYKMSHLESVYHLTEVEFIKNFFTHQNWIYQPVYFRLNGGSYHPDFYDGERNVFIEVAGTFQAFYDNRDKYRTFIKTYPKINFEIRTAKGTEIPITATEGTFPLDERK